MNSVKVGDYIDIYSYPNGLVKELFVISINGENLTVVDLLGNKKDISIKSIAKVHSK